MIGPDAFCLVLADYFGLDGPEIRPDTRLGLDAGFDSLMMLECVLMVEELAEHALDDHAIASIGTVGDLYRLYVQEESRLNP